MGPDGPAGRDWLEAGYDRLRAGHADREYVIETLKNAFVYGRLTKDELDLRVGRALAARTHAELGVLTADIPPAAAATTAEPACPPAPARRRPLARAAARSVVCLIIGVATFWVGVQLDPFGTPRGVLLTVAISALGTAAGIMAHALFMVWDQKCPPRQLPPRRVPDGLTPTPGAV